VAKKRTRRLPRQPRERAGRPRQETGLSAYVPALVAGAVVLLAVLGAIIYAKKRPEKRRTRPRRERVDYSAKWFGEGYKRGGDWLRHTPGKKPTEAQLREIADLMTSDYNDMAKDYEDSFIGGFMKATMRGR